MIVIRNRLQETKKIECQAQKQQQKLIKNPIDCREQPKETIGQIFKAILTKLSGVLFVLSLITFLCFVLLFRCSKLICYYHSKCRYRRKQNYKNGSIVSCISQNCAATNKLFCRDFNKLECYSFMQATLDWFTISLMSSRKQDQFVLLFHHKFCLLFSRLLCHSKITAETSSFIVVTDREKGLAKEFYLKCVGHMCVQGGCKGSFSAQHLASILITRKGREWGAGRQPEFLTTSQF